MQSSSISIIQSLSVGTHRNYGFIHTQKQTIYIPCIQQHIFLFIASYIRIVFISYLLFSYYYYNYYWFSMFYTITRLETSVNTYFLHSILHSVFLYTHSASLYSSPQKTGLPHADSLLMRQPLNPADSRKPSI